MIDRATIQKTQKVHDLLSAGNRGEAESLCLELYEHHPDEAEVLFALAMVRLNQGNYLVCTEMLHRCLSVCPAHREARRQLLCCYIDMKCFDEIVSHATSFAGDLDDDDAVLLYLAYCKICDWEKAGALEQRVIGIALAGKVAHSLAPSLLLAFTANPNISPELNSSIHKVFGQQISAGISARTSWPRSHTGKIRIAYLSADFYLHSVGNLLLSLIQQHDRNRFEVFCYAHLRRDDAVTEQFRNISDHFIDISHMNDEQVAGKAYADEIDILIELGGHTAYSRVGVMPYHPAPVQCSYLGYPVTTGVDGCDFRISCHSAESAGAQRLYSEKLLLLPEGFLFRTDFPEVNRASAPPMQSNGYVTFGSFNEVRKLNPESIALWSRIMLRIENSRLIVKGRGADNQVIQKHLLNTFANHGIDAGRIEFPPFAPVYEEHVAQCNRVDLALDPFPYHGTATTSETLWMGIPVMTLVGEAHVQRASYALMHQIGCDATSAFSEQEYEERAVALVSNVDKLEALRLSLPEMMGNSSLCRPELFMPEFEQILLQACNEKGFALPESEPEIRADLGQELKRKQFTLPGGVRIVLPETLENRTTYVLSEQGDWFDESIRFLRRAIGRGMSVFDVNAGYGCYALTLARLVRHRGSVTAFESDPEKCNFLELSIKQNRFKQLRQMPWPDTTWRKEAWKETDVLCVHEDGAFSDLKAFELLLIEGSPLVMVQAFSQVQAAGEMRSWMESLGYQTYRLVPGPGILVQADSEWQGNARQSYLFFCKLERAQKLAKAGCLVVSELENVSLPEDADLWIGQFKGHPWTKKLLPIWKQLAEENAANPVWLNLRNALLAYQLAYKKNQGAAASYGYLCASLSLLLDAPDLQENGPRLSSCARVAAELGRDDDAVAALTILQSLIEKEQTFMPREPFLPVHTRFDGSNFNLRIADWMLTQSEVQLELLQRPTAWPDAANLLKVAGAQQRRDFPDSDIARRAEVARKRPKS